MYGLTLNKTSLCIDLGSSTLYVLICLILNTNIYSKYHYYPILSKSKWKYYEGKNLSSLLVASMY